MAVSEKMVEAALDAAEFVPYQWREMPFADRWQARMRRALEAAEAVRGGDGARWRHKVRGTVYTEIGRAEVQISGSLLALSEGADVVVYRGEDGKLWARPVAEFHDGRFERVDAPSAAPLAGTVAVRVAVAFADDGSVWAETLYDPDCSSWAELAANGYSRRSCIATIHAPLPDVAEVGAVVEGVDRG